MLLGQATDHEQAEQTRRGLIELGWVRDTLVENDQVIVADAKAFVLNLEFDSRVGLSSRDVNRRGWIGELGGVVEKLSEHVGDVGNDSTTHLNLWQVTNFDPLEVLDLSQR